MRSEAEVREALEGWSDAADAERDQWSAAWAEALEWVLS